MCGESPSWNKLPIRGKPNGPGGVFLRRTLDQPKKSNTTMKGKQHRKTEYSIELSWRKVTSMLTAYSWGNGLVLVYCTLLHQCSILCGIYTVPVLFVTLVVYENIFQCQGRKVTLDMRCLFSKQAERVSAVWFWRIKPKPLEN